MRLLLAAVVLATAAPAASAATVLGVPDPLARVGKLAPYDPLTLRRTGPFAGSWSGFTAAVAVSADERRVVVSHGASGDLTVVDVERRVARRIGNTGTPLYALMWRGERLIGVRGHPDTPAEVVEVDPVAGVVARRPLGFELLEMVETPGGLALMGGPVRGSGASRVVLADVGRPVRVHHVPGVRSGDSRRGSDFHPGLASDGRTAWVVGGPGLRVAEVDLASGRSSLHVLARPGATAAKYGPGPLLDAVHLGEGRLAVSGTEGRFRGIGLWIVDTLAWRSRRLVARAHGFVWAPPVVMAHGARGLRAFTPDGRLRWTLPVKGVTEAHGGLAYVRNSARRASRRRLRVVDVRSGAVLRTTQASDLPRLLVP